MLLPFELVIVFFLEGLERVWSFLVEEPPKSLDKVKELSESERQ